MRDLTPLLMLRRPRLHDTYRQKLFDEQIAPSINAIIANDTNHIIEQEFKEVWDNEPIDGYSYSKILSTPTDNGRS